MGIKTTTVNLGYASATQIDGDFTQNSNGTWLSVASADSIVVPISNLRIIVNAGALDDTVSGGAGFDTIHGGAGNDLLYAGAAGGNFFGDAGDDLLVAGIGGNLILDGGSGNDTILGGAGDDRIQGELGSDTMDGGAGNDTILGGDLSNSGLTDKDSITGGLGNDHIEGGNGANTIDAGEGNDNIYGGPGADYIDAGPGDDTIDGAGGNNTIVGGTGNDSIAGAVSIEGGDGNDTISGGNWVAGGAGNDSISFVSQVGGWATGDAGDDSISLYYSFTGTLTTTPGSTVDGGDGADTVTGGYFSDSISGGAGNDSLSGLDGNDTLIGGMGDDTLVGGLGNDVLQGGDGMDVAVFADNLSNRFVITWDDVKGAVVVNDTFTPNYFGDTPNGVDVLYNVEYLQFGSGTLLAPTKAVQFSTASWNKQANGSLALTNFAGAATTFKVNGFTVYGQAVASADREVVITPAPASTGNPAHFDYSVGTVKVSLGSTPLTVNLDTGDVITSAPLPTNTLGGLALSTSSAKFVGADVKLGVNFNLPVNMGGAKVGLSGGVGLVAGANGISIQGDVGVDVALPDTDVNLLGKLSAHTKDVHMSFASSTDTFKLIGSLVVNPVAPFPSITMKLADPGLSIKSGALEAVNLAVDIGDFSFKGWGFKSTHAQLVMGTLKDDGLTGSTHIEVPFAKGTAALDASVGFTLGPMQLNSVGLNFTPPTPIPVFSTPVFITKLGGSLSNLASASTDPVLFQGLTDLDIGRGVTVGKFTLTGELDENHASGKLDGYLISKEILSLNVDASLDWNAGTLEMSGSADLEKGLVTANLSFKSDFDLNFTARGDGTVHILGLNGDGHFVVKFSNDKDLSNDYVAAWATISKTVQFGGVDITASITKGIKITFDGETSTFGEADVPIYKSWIVDASIKDITMQASWVNASTASVLTRVVVYSDMSKTTVSQVIDESQYQSNGIAVLDAFGDSTHKFVWVAKTTPGVYDLEVLNPQALGTITYSATTSLQALTLDLGAASIQSGSLELNYAATAPAVNAHVQFYVDTNNAGFDGQTIGITNAVSSDGHFSWDTSTLAPGQYWVYGMVADDKTVPVFDYAPTAITVSGASDCSVTVIQGAGAVAGQDFLVTLQVCNTGERTAHHVDVAALLPTGMVLDAASVTSTGTDAQGTHYLIDTLTPGETSWVKLVVHADLSGAYTVKAGVTSTAADKDLTNNVQMADLTIASTGPAADTVLPAVLLTEVQVAERAVLHLTLPSGFAPSGSQLSALLSDGTPLPTWLHFDPATGAFDGAPTQADVGTLSIAVRASNANQATIADTLVIHITNVNDAPTGSVTISGTTTQGQTLTASNTLSDLDGLGAISYQWQADGISINGATGSTLVLGQTEVGKVIGVVASYTDASGTAESVASTASTFVMGNQTGTAGDDVLTGTAFDDTLNPGTGADLINAGAGNDTINLTPDGSGLSAWVFGVYAAANQGLPGSAFTGQQVPLNGNMRYFDIVNGAVGTDTVQLTNSSDAYFLDDVYSRFNASAVRTNDAQGKLNTARVVAIENIHGGAGDDIIDLTSTNYSIAGVNLFGDAGNDILWGNVGNDTLQGGDGNDTLFGGSGSNTLNGGLGADLFQYAKGGTAHDTIEDFEPGTDKIELFGAASTAEVTAAIHNGHATLTWGTQTLDLIGITSTAGADAWLQLA